MPLDGLQLGHYRLLRMLGAGGMGEVYLAEDSRISRQVAIKVIKSDGMPYPGTLSEDDANRLFLREAKAIASLQHPYILQLFDYGEVAAQDGMLSYLVMPYCQESSLDTWLRKRRSYRLSSLYVISHILDQAADALQYAHEKQIIHQDVKLSNFLIHRWNVSGMPDLLLADFGVAKFLSAQTHSSQSIRGTPSSMAPEQWEGHPVPATDQYALAIMIYQLLTGNPPFQGGPGQIMYQHLTVQPQPPSTQQQGITSSIDAVILKALKKQPEERFETMLKFAQAFRLALPDVSDVQAMGKDVPGNDLNVSLALSTDEAISGTRRTLKLPTGRSIQFSIPAGVKTGQTLRVDVSEHDTSSQTLVVTILVMEAKHEVPSPVVVDEQTTIRASTLEIAGGRETPPVINQTLETAPPSLINAIPPTISSFSYANTPVKSAMSSSEQAGYQRRRFPGARGLLLVLLVILLVAGSAGITFYLTRSSPQVAVTNSITTTTQTSALQNKTTVTSAPISVGETATTTANQYASATAGVQSQNLTTTAQAVSSNPYPPYTGTLVLNDPLRDNSEGYSWEEGTRDQGTCTFTDGAYQSDIPLSGYFHSCLALSVNYRNFAYEVQMTLVSASAGGIVFRADRATTHLYYFTVDRKGGYQLKAYFDKVGDYTVVASWFWPNIF